MPTDRAHFPPVDELANLAMRELRRFGGRCDVDVFRRAIAARFPTSEASPRKRKARQAEFDNALGWAMAVLESLDEVHIRLASSTNPAVQYELVAPASPEMHDEREAEERRRDRFAYLVDEYRKQQWDD